MGRTLDNTVCEARKMCGPERESLQGGVDLQSAGVRLFKACRRSRCSQSATLRQQSKTLRYVCHNAASSICVSSEFVSTIGLPFMLLAWLAFSATSAMSDGV